MAGASKSPTSGRGTDLYAVLGVSPRASAEQIRAAYRQKARALHPDVNPAADAERAFAQAARAWEVLGDPALRARYDARRAGRSAVAGPVARADADGDAAGPAAGGRYTWSNIAGRPSTPRRGHGAAQGPARSPAGDPADHAAWQTGADAGRWSQQSESGLSFEELYEVFFVSREKWGR